MAHISRKPAVTTPENAAARSTLSKLQRTRQTDRRANDESKNNTDRHGDGKTGNRVFFWRGCSSASSRQKSSFFLSLSFFFYLQRRHDIPCPLKPATERCSPCSCCRCPSLAITSTATRRAARNPIGLTGTVPNSSERRHWGRRVRGRQSQSRREEHAGQRGRVEEQGKDTESWRQRQLSGRLLWRRTKRIPAYSLFQNLLSSVPFPCQLLLNDKNWR